MNIRRAMRTDLSAITEIYNEAVLHTTATFDTVPRTLEQQEQWYAQHGREYPVLVAEADGTVVGWSSLNRYSDRPAYARTAELSLYIHSDRRGQGIGKTLLGRTLEEGRTAGLHTVISRITGGNDSSIHLHRIYGFETVGTMREVGIKFGQWLDVVIMQKLL
ncbi:GNAT family N-acetyltransferase [Paenibacillus ginsengihumi]|uniref:GNAT family N-acetyltransferase n=1 Tax=Paenibacillus ginsengihumi TaxID=431596 RepID=UPI00037C4275|nr:GNAT family N-acetyltransferase [Paenibacillus ginsengihumi]